ncbi:MAG: 2-amino-4-hydroxy-6-hydroxymethyldihydropteridine diphosphokinase [Pseudomonadales bacterium]|nr:2-amino-4-hydroxy-6-hydroxymethyldihydropteridine diphosphokinase [Pseudomonadales bacterium]MBO6563403.1 2-amino-4-hydroxy-6-hydroxymethyldihydropteridine diphosphokinase [Pseudomonadales bacterium]MBO6597948.1 2-amino-4-hydroxy-6-hydroxymethyldihydropteridine diphosphokinase [Pseudomonadales bacterium]MBO6823030.1 2-amino-4-hydroxy-6-hydroxymethyldihydropteridine diphosphokinase [Pseudomonadales bacterium]
MADTVLIGLGSNLGDTVDNLLQGAKVVARLASGATSGSSIWTSRPEGFDEEVPDFANAVLKMKVTLGPETLLSRLQQIENEFGRVRPSGGGYQSRILDLDIIDFGGKVHASVNLVLPHPRAHLRKFVLVPLYEIEPEFLFPDRQEDIETLLAAAPENEMVRLTPLIPSD